MKPVKARILSLLADVVLLGAGCGSVLFLNGRAEREQLAPEVPTHPSAPRRELPRKGSGSPEECFKEALHDLAAALAEKGARGSISGRVVTTEGLPLPGVTIRCGAKSSPGDAPVSERNFEEKIVEYVRGLARRPVATTDAGGSFRFDDLESGLAYRVTASHESHETSPAEGVDPDDAHIGEHLTFVAKPVERFVLQVACILPDGSSPRYASINARCLKPQGASQEVHFSWTPEKATIASRLPIRRLSARCSVDPLEYRSDQLDVPPAEKGEPVFVEVRLKSIPGIRGRIFSPQGQRPESSKIEVRAVPVEEPRQDPSRLGEPGRGFAVDYGAGGILTYRSHEVLAQGLYWVVVTMSACDSVLADAFVEVGDRMVVRDFSILPVPPDRALRIWAYGRDGKALQELSVSFHLPDGSWGGSPPAFQEDPYRWIVAVPERVLARPEAGWILVAKNDAFGRAEVPFAPGRDRELRVEYIEPALLVVKMEGYVRSLYPRGFLRFALHPIGELRRDNASDMEAEVHWSAESGLAFFSVQPGEYELRALFSPAGGSCGMEVARHRLSLGSGPNEIAIPLPPAYEVRVTIPAEGQSRGFTLLPKGSISSLYSFSGRPGRRTMPPLPQGTYVLRSADGKEMEFSLPGPTEIAFDSRGAP